MKILTNRTRARVAVLAAVPLLLLTGCGGDDPDGGGDDAAADGDVPALQGEDCDAEVTLTGAIEASWSGNATVDTSDSVAPPATYQSSDAGTILTVSAVGNGFDDPTVILLADGRSFGVPFGEGSVDVSADGSGATIDAAAPEVGGEGGTVQVTATFTC